MKKLKPYYKRKIYKRKKGQFGKPKFMLQGRSKTPTASTMDMANLAGIIGSLIPAFGGIKIPRKQHKI